MTNIDTVIVTTRLEFIARYLNNLKRFEIISLDEYLDSFDTQLIIERLLQLMAQAAIDINDHILSKLNPGKSKTNFDTFIELGKYGVISTGVRHVVKLPTYLSLNLVNMVSFLLN